MGTTRDGRAQRRIRNNSRAISGSEREGGERERGFKTGKCGREIKSFGRRLKRQKRNGLLRKYPYSINAAHSVLRCSHFRFTASTFWQKKSSLFNLADKLHDESTFLSLCFCLYSPCRRLRFISKAL